MRNVVILGLTGSIGTTALKGCKNNSNAVRIIGATCHSNIEKAITLCKENNIKNLCVFDSNQKLDNSCGITIWYDLKEMLLSINPDVVLNGISGSAGLRASLDVIECKITLALANKESVVLGGKLLFDYAKKNNVRIIPVDSEHSAIDELIQTNGIENIAKLVITASGGPFLHSTVEELENITPQIAANHPTWKMGPKISIDSSTLANKGLEVIEAHYLFGFDAEHIEVVIHPQSIVHSMVRTTSGQVYAQMSPPDMTFPIMRALLDRKYESPVGKELDFTCLDLNFRKWSSEQFPLLKNAFDCVKNEGIYPIVYNIADEVAVQAFMDGKIKFTQIPGVISKSLDLNWNIQVNDIKDIPSILDSVKERIKI